MNEFYSKKRSGVLSEIPAPLFKRFKKFHMDNPLIWAEFKHHAREMRATGRPRYSAWAIINKIRWDSDIKTKGDTFKICNDYIACYSRLLIYHYPEFKKFFVLHRMGPR